MNNPHLSRSVLADPSSLPLRSSSTLSDWGTTLVVAPHPDDESLGCGGVIAMLKEAGHRVVVLFVSDGSQSHPDSREYPSDRLASLRKTEAQAALEILGVPPDDQRFLNLPDSRIPHWYQDEFSPAVALFQKEITAVNPTTVLTPWRRDVHHDHIATTALVHKAAPDIRTLEYPLWVWDATSHDQTPSSGEMTAWRIDIASVLEKKKAAVAAHKSQTTQLITDDPGGFVLSKDQIERCLHPYEIFFEPAQKTATESLTPGYFDGMYEEKEDPWEFATSEYEAGKYRETLAALPHQNYERILELGCSVGVLTARLAEYADEIIAVEISEKALQSARARCREFPHILFEKAFLPHDWPNGKFDLILISEVAYYLSNEDLEILRDQVVSSLTESGQILLVHWTPQVASYPQTGDYVHEYFRSLNSFHQVKSERHDCFRLDLLQRD